MLIKMQHSRVGTANFATLRRLARKSFIAYMEKKQNECLNLEGGLTFYAFITQISLEIT